MNISKGKLLIFLLIMIFSFTLTGCKEKEFEENIKVEDIFNQGEDSYLVYFYMNDCRFCKSCFNSVNDYIRSRNNELMPKVYTCNLSDPGNEIIKRSFEEGTGQGKSGTYFVDGVSDYKDLYISGVPSLIRITPDDTAKFVVSGRSDIKTYFRDLTMANRPEIQ